MGHKATSARRYRWRLRFGEERAATLAHWPERLLARNGLEDLVVVPGIVRNLTKASTSGSPRSIKSKTSIPARSLSGTVHSTLITRRGTSRKRATTFSTSYNSTAKRRPPKNFMTACSHSIRTALIPDHSGAARTPPRPPSRRRSNRDKALSGLVGFTSFRP